MKKVLVVLFILIGSSALHAQNPVVTTFILVRHAEKTNDGTSDPELSPEGKERANRLASLLAETTVAAVYSTKYKRTENTVKPIATVRDLVVDFYEPANTKAIDDMLRDHAGSTIVVCGHSNTIPRIANQLLGSHEFDDFDESDYGNILVVTVVAEPRVATVTRLRY